MNKLLLVSGCLLLVAGSYGQTVSQKLQKAFIQFEGDSQLKHAISSLYVIDAKTGQVVLDENSQVGLAPASTQKIITSVTAFELLGNDYRYKTEFGRCTGPEKELGLWIGPSGDPTFGSWRWESTKEKNILDVVINEIKKIGDLKNYKSLIINTTGWNGEQIPDGWIWQDIGNYYGAAPGIINWKENQYDITLRSGYEVGGKVDIISSGGYLNELKAAAKGTGDNAYAYLPQGAGPTLIVGTIPIAESSFNISASNPYVIEEFLNDFGYFIFKKGIKGKHLNAIGAYDMSSRLIKGEKFRIISTHYSPSLDSIIYWFLKKSINLYGEALLKTFAYEKKGFGSTDSGVAIVKKFWKDKGLDENELNIYDGSGLSPLNRVTTHAQVEILKYAKTRDWFPYFLKSLPDYNGMTMKSGTISDVKGFCGYHKAKDGKEYIFSFLVNNYSGKTSGMVGKMYKMLDELK